MINVGMVDLFVRAEGLLERKLMVLAVSYPLIILEKSNGFEPQVDLKAKEFWKQFIAKSDEIRNSSDPIKDALDCANPLDIAKFNQLIDPLENCYTAAENIISEINAARLARKATRWLESSSIFQKVKNYDG